ncbi:alginate lyase family protein [Pedobacter sp. B4-66]|uniref:alginate lyase family protein n=1 Tax=Pedobacter sp. B4-66 TaxID=2817280 RepID=UPI001BD99F08|nr:alginate lyase family protein [Pedobacter sp. B4-66]
MYQKIQKAGQLIGNMGWRYITFRVGFELKKKSGLLKRKFPLDPPLKTFFSLKKWKAEAKPFFFENMESILTKESIPEGLERDYKNLSEYKYPFFSSLEYDLGANYDWITNPDTGFQYDANAHWLDINDYDQKAGDIKFVWEPSRFSHLYTMIRYDKYFGEDCSKQVFNEIERWLDGNKINQGPNFKCSQEISLRIMNWTFALYYYKDSPNLTEGLFNKIQHYIYHQAQHVYDNINFSRIAVRNNHAITETLLLYLVGLLFPQFPRSNKWKKDGKRWFEQEIEYQVYQDGTFLQFSMNYHRVVIQLLTWAIRLSELNKEKFEDVVYDRAEKSLKFLMSSLNEETGFLPNYGNNDGALFFKLNNAHYRDYMPQLEALSYSLGFSWPYRKSEDAIWYGLESSAGAKSTAIENGVSMFGEGGYYIFRSPDSLSFIRAGKHKDRPAQADNLHLDLWYNEKNILHDGGTYKYNCSPEDLKYFMGTRSHNTVMLDDNDQMEKGSRFIWYHWTQCEKVKTEETEDYFLFEGTVSAFRHIDKNIMQIRKLKIWKKQHVWEIEDTIIGKPKEMLLRQIWHTRYPEMLTFESVETSGKPITPTMSEGYYSEFYGIKEACSELTLSTYEENIKTIISIK